MQDTYHGISITELMSSLYHFQPGPRAHINPGSNVLLLVKPRIRRSQRSEAHPDTELRRAFLPFLAVLALKEKQAPAVAQQDDLKCKI